MKIALKRAWWSQNVDAGNGQFSKSLVAGPKLDLWYLGHAVLIEQEGQPDRLVPSACVLTVEPVGKWDTGYKTWAEVRPPDNASDTLPPMPLDSRPAEPPQEARRGPGRPKKMSMP